MKPVPVYRWILLFVICCIASLDELRGDDLASRFDALVLQLDDPRFRFLTGPLQAVQDLKKQLGILSKPDQALVIKHTMRTILVGPDLKIAYHVPGSMWGVEDFLEKIHDLPQDKSS